MTNLILVERSDGYAEVVLNRPHRKNALTETLVESLSTALRESEEDPDVQAVLLRGADGCWCSGIDLKQADLARFGPLWQQLHREISRMRTPVVGALEGVAINAGAALALACDLVVAGRSAYLRIMEATLGMAAPVNSAWLLARHSPALGARLVLAAEPVAGDRLVDLGLAHQAVEDADVFAQARALTARIAGYPQGAGALVKDPFRVGPDGRSSFEHHLDRLTNP